jgi:6-phosphogluconolactonase (cycloisomerase 2 family)
MRIHLWLTRTAALTGLALALLFTPGHALGRAPSLNTYVYVAENGQSNGIGSLAQFQMLVDGSLMPLSPPTVMADAYGNPGSVIVDPSGKTLLTVNTSTESILQFPVHSNGTLGTSATKVTSANGFTSIAYTPNGRFAVVNNAASVSSYGVSSTGAWTPINTVPTGRSGLSVVVDPSGKFVYVANEALSLLSGYTISAVGTLAPLEPNNIFQPGYLPFMLAISPNGFLYSSDAGAGTVVKFSINSSTGALARTGSFSTGSGRSSEPRWITFTPNGAFAFVANTNDGTVSQFIVNPNNGALTRNGSDIPTGRFPLQVFVDPSGSFVFTANGDGTVSEFTISGTGMLTLNGSVSLGPDSSYAIAFVQR